MDICGLNVAQQSERCLIPGSLYLFLIAGQEVACICMRVYWSLWCINACQLTSALYIYMPDSILKSYCLAVQKSLIVQQSTGPLLPDSLLVPIA